MSRSDADLTGRLLSGDRRTAARLITLIENGADGMERELQKLYPHTGKAHVVGITGPPGSGKSTLTGGLAREFRSRGKSVGIIAVDPTSPFTGGAVLGDRVRMQELALDPGVFIRSMASRAALGGLSRATGDVVRVLDALGCEIILVETVGAGQAEVDVARAAHSIVVVEVPAAGDGIQMTKAGILEIADLFAVNKADRGGADQVVAELKAMLHMGAGQAGWTPPILKTIATSGEGVAALADALGEHLKYLEQTGVMERRLRDNALRELLDAAGHQFIDELRSTLGEQQLAAITRQILERRLDPRSAAKELVQEFRKSPLPAGEGQGEGER